MKRSPAARVAVLLAGALLLAGCGGPAPTPPASSSSTATTSPTPTSPPSATSAPTTTAPTTDTNIPAAARAYTPAGAEAFVRYFFERLNLAWTGPRAGILSLLCEPSAVACRANEKTATRLVAEGHRYDGNPVTVKFIGTLDATKANRFEVLANVTQERRREIDAQGKVYVTDQRKDLRLDFVLIYKAGAWSVASTQIMK